MLRALVLIACLSGTLLAIAEERVLLWGDTHLHTNNSFDAFLNGNLSATPETAYRYARGYPVTHPYNRTRVQIQTPLDFLVVSDHAEFYGGMKDIYFGGIQDSDPNILERIFYWYYERRVRNAIDSETGPAFFRDLMPVYEDPRTAIVRWVEDTNNQSVPGANISANRAWRKLGEVAEAYNEPGKFTAFLGWEWSTIPGGANLHRIIVTDADAERAQLFLPFGSNDSPFPDDLWRWLEKTEQASGARFVAIPHNSNISRGTMFSRETMRGDPITRDYAELRMRWEPIVEITQIKGDSETHPDLSPDDRFADFETYPWWILRDRVNRYEATKADFIRSALRTGMEMQREVGANPFQFGVIGSTDSHTGLASAEEPNFWGKMAFDSIPERKQGPALADGPTGWSMQAGGLAAVWAEENSRAAILDGFKRRETYATTGPRVTLRVFAGFGFTDDDLASEDFAARGYAEGVPMGAELRAIETGTAPVFMVKAEKDPISADLDRIQMIKGWLDPEGNSQERIYNIAWSGDRSPDADGSIADVDDTVDRSTGAYTNDVGEPSLMALWQDPDFDAKQTSFYYLRVLEIPTPRHALLDAIALGLGKPTEGPETIQERAYSSPIWYRP